MLTDDEIRFLDSLAKRLSQALYYKTVGQIGNGVVSVGLRHDDYDRLTELTTKAKLEAWERQHPLSVEL